MFNKRATNNAPISNFSTSSQQEIISWLQSIMPSAYEIQSSAGNIQLIRKKIEDQGLILLFKSALENNGVIFTEENKNIEGKGSWEEICITHLPVSFLEAKTQESHKTAKVGSR